MCSRPSHKRLLGVRSNNWHELLLIDSSTVSPAVPKTLADGLNNDEDLASEETRLRTIKKGRSGPVFSSVNKTKSGMGAVQAVIG